MSVRVIEGRQLLQILVMFMIVQFAGLFLAALMFNGATYQQVSSTQVASAPSTALFLIVYIIAVTVVMILLMKFYIGVYRLFEGFVIFVASAIVFSILLSELTSATVTMFGSAVPVAFVAGGVLGIALVVAKNMKPWLRNATAILASVGVGVALGADFGFIVALVLMALLAVYDFIAVFITKHMITLADAVQKQNLAFMVDVREVEAVPKGSLSAAELSQYNRELAAFKKAGGKMQEIHQKGMKNMVPMVASVGLGTGDLAVPLMVAIAAYKVFLSFTLSMFVIFGAVIGLLLTMFILRRYKRALPAIPPLLFGIGIGIALYALVYEIL